MKLFKHKHYKTMRPKWVKWRDLYEGDHDTMVGPDYMIPHPIELMGKPETNRLYKGRKDRTRYLNIDEFIVSILVSFFYRKPPTLDDAAQKLLEGLKADKNIDGEGTSFQEFITDKITPQFLNLGELMVLAESFNVQAESAAQERELGLRPFLKLLSPLDCPDWENETADPKRLGELNAFRYEYYRQTPRARLSEAPVEFLCSDEYFLSGKQLNIAKYKVELDADGKAKKIIDGEIDWEFQGATPIKGLEKLPVTVLRRESWIKDVAEETLRHFNYRSNLDNCNHFQGYPTTVAIGVNKEDAEAYSMLSEYTMLILKDPDSRIERLPAGESAALEKGAQDALATAFKIGLNQVRSLQDSKQVQSGDTANEEKDNSYALVESSVAQLEDFTNRCLQDFALLAGQKDFKGRVIFNKEIKEEDIAKLGIVFNSFRDILMRVEGMDSAIAQKVIKSLNFDKDTAQDLQDKAESLEEDLAKKAAEKALEGGGEGQEQGGRFPAVRKALAK